MDEAVKSQVGVVFVGPMARFLDDFHIVVVASLLSDCRRRRWHGGRRIVRSNDLTNVSVVVLSFLRQRRFIRSFIRSFIRRTIWRRWRRDQIDDDGAHLQQGCIRRRDERPTQE